MDGGPTGGTAEIAGRRVVKPVKVAPNVRKLSSGKYQIIVRHEGKQYPPMTLPVGTPFKDVLLAADRFRLDVRTGEYEKRLTARAKQGQTLATFLDRWLAIYDRMEREAGTIGTYRGYVRKWKTLLDPKLPVGALTTTMVDDAIEQMQKAGLSGKYIKDLVMALSTAFNWGLGKKMVSDNPITAVDLPKVTPVRPKRALSLEEAKVLAEDLLAVDAPYERALVVGLVTGLRTESQIRALRKQDIHLDGERPYFELNAKIYEGRVTVLEDKGNSKNRRRRVSIPAELVPVFERQQRDIKAWPKLADQFGQFWVESEYFWVQENGTALATTTMRRQLAAALERTGLGHCTVHDLRRTAATIVSERDVVPPEAVQGMLGHTTDTMTKHYIQRSAEKGRAAVVDMAAAVLGERREAAV